VRQDLGGGRSSTLVSPLPWRTRILNWAEDEGEEEDDWADDIVVVHVD
jgi:hypothetical protein